MNSTAWPATNKRLTVANHVQRYAQRRDRESVSPQQYTRFSPRPHNQCEPNRSTRLARPSSATRSPGPPSRPACPTTAKAGNHASPVSDAGSTHSHDKRKTPLSSERPTLGAIDQAGGDRVRRRRRARSTGEHTRPIGKPWLSQLPHWLVVSRRCPVRHMRSVVIVQVSKRSDCRWRAIVTGGEGRQ